MDCYVYILASKRNGTRYIGVTNDLPARVAQHKSGDVSGFTQRYGVTKLVYYETTDCIHAAIQREKQLKKWRRAWKVNLIEESNPDWLDLYEGF